MIVKLDIKEDKELRNYIKDMIKGQVLSLTREEFLTIIRNELNSKIKGLDSTRFESLLSESMTKAIKEILSDVEFHGALNRQQVTAYVEKGIAERLDKARFDSIIHNLVEQSLKTRVLEVIAKHLGV